MEPELRHPKSEAIVRWDPGVVSSAHDAELRSNQRPLELFSCLGKKTAGPFLLPGGQ